MKALQREMQSNSSTEPAPATLLTDMSYFTVAESMQSLCRANKRKDRAPAGS